MALTISQQMCADNMAKIANSEFSCAAGDVGCFCHESNWAYGIRDCSQQACSADEAAQAITWASGQCDSTPTPSTRFLGPH